MELENEHVDECLVAAFNEMGVAEARKWSALVGLLLLRFERDPVIAVSALAREAIAVDRLDSLFADLRPEHDFDEDEDRTRKIRDRFDEFLSPLIIEKPF